MTRVNEKKKKSTNDSTEHVHTSVQYCQTPFQFIWAGKWTPTPFSGFPTSKHTALEQMRLKVAWAPKCIPMSLIFQWKTPKW